MNPIENETARRKQFIPEFEGLRGLLAAWVVFGHILLFCGFTYQDGWFGIVFSPILGVYTFMMLSGFVITAALDQRASTWLHFMSRRFWRLFPVYVLCMALAIISFNVSVNVSASPTLATFGPTNMTRLADVDQHFCLYLAADSTLLQCLMPRYCFPYGSESFLPPTWSLTIEWLFYMVVPFLVLLIKRNWLMAIGAICSFTLAIYLLGPFLTENVNQAFHVGNVFHFLTGIGSYYVWKKLPETRRCFRSTILFWATIASGIALLHLPYKIWLATMVIVLYRRVHQRPMYLIELPRKILNSALLQSLGRMSYVTYLLHWIVIEIVIYCIIQLVPGLSDRLILATLCIVTVYPLTYIFSHGIHRCIEIPMMKIPKHWGKKRVPLKEQVTAPT